MGGQRVISGFVLTLNARVAGHIFMSKLTDTFHPDDIPAIRGASGNLIPLADLLHIDTDQIDHELEIQTGWQATIGFAHAFAKSRTEEQQRALARLGAELTLEFKRNLFEKTKIKPTADAVEAAVKLEPEYIKLEDELAEAELRESLLDVAVKSFHCRREMLVNISASLRIDRKTT